MSRADTSKISKPVHLEPFTPLWALAAHLSVDPKVLVAIAATGTLRCVVQLKTEWMLTKESALPGYTLPTEKEKSKAPIWQQPMVKGSIVTAPAELWYEVRPEAINFAKNNDGLFDDNLVEGFRCKKQISLDQLFITRAEAARFLKSGRELVSPAFRFGNGFAWAELNGVRYELERDEQTAIRALYKLHKERRSMTQAEFMENVMKKPKSRLRDVFKNKGHESTFKALIVAEKKKGGSVRLNIPPAL